MPGRELTTFGLALVLVLIGALASASTWFMAFAWAFALFILFWGRDSERTEAMVSRIPGCGQFLVRVLHQLDLIISPRDQEYENHLRKVVTAYDPHYRQSLRKLLETRLPSQITRGPLVEV